MTKQEEFAIIADVIRSRLLKSAEKKFPVTNRYRIKWGDGHLSQVYTFEDYIPDIDWDSPEDEIRLIKELLAAVQDNCYPAAILRKGNNRYSFFISSTRDLLAQVELID